MEGPAPKSLTVLRYSKSKQTWRYTTGSDGFLQPFPSTLILISWNIDKSASSPYERLLILLEYIKLALDKCRVGPTTTTSGQTERPPPPCCILLQEVHREAFAGILADGWVREYFQVIPGSPAEWPGGQETYGNVTILARSVPASNARWMVFGDSAMGRNAVIVDVHLNVPASRPEWGAIAGGKGKERLASVTMRIANAHLESHADGISIRARQLGAVAKELKDNMIDGGLVCGDMNAVRVEDAALPRMFELSDAWVRGEYDEQGYTWGHQLGRGNNRPGRLDKILYWQYRNRFLVEEPRILGIGLKMQQGTHVSDHYGLLSLIRFQR